MDPRIERFAQHAVKLLGMEETAEALIERFAEKIEKHHSAAPFDDSAFLNATLEETWTMINGRSNRNDLQHAVGWAVELSNEERARDVVVALTLLHFIGRARWIMAHTQHAQTWREIYGRFERIATKSNAMPV